MFKAPIEICATQTPIFATMKRIESYNAHLLISLLVDSKLVLAQLWCLSLSSWLVLPCKHFPNHSWQQKTFQRWCLRLKELVQLCNATSSTPHGLCLLQPYSRLSRAWSTGPARTPHYRYALRGITFSANEWLIDNQQRINQHRLSNLGLNICKH